MRTWMKTILMAAVATVALSSVAVPVLHAGEFVWMEGESGKADIKVNNAGWGNAQFLSNGKWMHVAIDPDKVDEQIKGEAATIAYPFEIKKGAKYEVWNRIGLEFARTLFEYRIDNGVWKQIKPDDLTTDLMELDFFCEVAWIKMGEADLTPGQHLLEIRLPKTKGGDGKMQKVLYASDAICINEGVFHPNSKFKPNESGQDEKDLAAAKNVFKLPESKGPERASVSLKGVWEVTRDDEQLPTVVAEPIKALPEVTHFRAIEVPSDKNEIRKDLVFAHRIWYRTRVEVPAGMAGRSVYINFPYNSLNTTVYVNGVYCGFEKNPFCDFDIDISKAVKPGQVNEVWVGIRDAWYGRTANPDNPMKLRRTFNVPLRFFGNGFQDLDYPIWSSPSSGILCTPTIYATGEVYATDVFVKPSVQKKQLEAEVTLRNNGGKDAAGEIRWEAVNDKTGQVEKSFAAKPFTVAAGRTEMLSISEGWENPKLWWPDDANMYRLRTTVAVGGKVLDVKETSFGFREWKIQGTQFTLNGVVWHLWADLSPSGSTAEAWVKSYRDHNVRLTRFSTAGQGGVNTNWFGMEPQQALDYMDRSGVVVRRNMTLDGEGIGSNFSEADKEIVKKQGGSELKLTLMQNWLDQCVAQARGERNHPSIQIWSIENEFAFINLINLLGNSPNMDQYEKLITRTSDAVMKVDPTRSVMIDGGGALKENTLPVHGDHYVATLDTRYPDLAYEPFVEGGGRGRWKWDQKRPRYIGEDYFATGINPADYAMWGGEVCFQGKAATRDAVATAYRFLQEGYRWGEYYAGWHFWVGGEGGEREFVANAPRAVLCRNWDWSFASGQKVQRTFGIFNDTQHPEPLTFTWVLSVGGKEVHGKTSQHDVKPGMAEKFDDEIAMPQVTSRQEGQLLLTLSAGGKELFRDVKEVSVLPPAVMSSALPSDSVAVLDPKGVLGEFLKSAKVAYTPVNSLENLPQGAKVLVVAPDAISATESTSTALAAFASSGRSVIVLDQDNPLRYQAIPAEMDLAPTKSKSDFGDEIPVGKGRMAFIEDGSHPVFKGIKDKDFFTWTGDHVVYRNAYTKPTRGGKSLLQVGPRLTQTALVEVPVGKGVMYLSQLDLSEKLASNVVAQQMLTNLISYGVQYKQEFANVSACVQDEQLAKTLDGIGVQYAKAGDALAAISDADRKIAIVSATPQNLKLLASNMEKVQAFWNRGGNIVFHGLTPEGLADYNKIVGFEHVIRPFGRERVTFPAVRNPLTSGLTTGDIVMLSGQRIFGFTADEYVVSDEFTYVVDYDEIAPFAKSDFGNYGNITNGFVGSDGWPLIIDFPAPKDGKPLNIKLDLPKEETVTELTYKASMNYGATTKIGLLFDGKDPVEFAMQPNGDAQTFTVPPHKAKTLTLQVLGFQLDPAKAANIGIDNIWIKVQRQPEFMQNVKPMLNLGGMMQYVKGNGAGTAGGVVLCNLKLQETEAVPANKEKKRTILATVLRNLKAPFASGKTVIAAANMLTCQPLDIHTKATTYKDERGWFGDKNRTFGGLPQGTHTLQGVQYNIYEMPTSPVPQVLMLAGNGVPGNLPKEIRDIPVNAKADALFFLHAAKMGNRANDQERREHKKFEMFKYVVNYADGSSVEVPVYSETDIENYVQEQPKALPGAQLAWTRPYENSKDQAVAYSKQWNNPKPDIAIKSVDMIPVDASRGTPVLLALTAATAK